MEITYYGHACFAFKTSAESFIIDPFITENELAKHIDINSIKADYIFLSHAHYDHILDAETIAKNNNATILANAEIATHYSKKGIKVLPMNIGGVKKFGFGKVKMVNAIHSSSFPDGTYGGLAAGFLMKVDEKVVYFSGDTALCTDMKLLPFVYGHIHIAILPIGNTYTMGVYDAVVASKFVQAQNVIACHYDTFPAIKINNKEKAKQLFSAEEKKLTFMEIGSTKDANDFKLNLY
ncbi:metal-dependent hydrolase [Apibacter muscae]|uniref:Metal-dependent hydrolase n=1 Tax=Apibacter muscae TaxID=2509004 RepID=A0A563DFW9_9FLAO|nr:metal-dependent hydrolase [Apibacter muscae]TWP24371.1 metal-dependent hydrolase [Apibacter muscae]TWP28684.1 metal-dependent hydrolase [Apibacter muscae]TWP30067.1 metal-dependent hydrolase [Apibacter muscae]